MQEEHRNSNDLRGKIIRIRVKEDGSYEVPDGNFFQKINLAPNLRYVMGNRNPIVFQWIKKTVFSIGARSALIRTSIVCNQEVPGGMMKLTGETARVLWLAIIHRNNYAYYNYDYNTGKSGEKFDP
jgi:hypothetical protein